MSTDREKDRAQNAHRGENGQSGLGTNLSYVYERGKMQQKVQRRFPALFAGFNNGLFYQEKLTMGSVLLFLLLDHKIQQVTERQLA